jgi:hyperosmotically inducible protein
MCISKNKQAILRSITLSLPILLATFAGVSYAQTANPQPDNTKVNQRDRDPNEPTADQQKMNASDQQLTTTIRKSIMADKSLSTYAHNVKVISQNGTVTLKGPVRSEDEHKSLLAKAASACGSADKVHDEMSVKP